MDKGRDEITSMFFRCWCKHIPSEKVVLWSGRPCDINATYFLMENEDMKSITISEIVNSNDIHAQGKWIVQSVEHSEKIKLMTYNLQQAVITRVSQMFCIHHIWLHTSWGENNSMLSQSFHGCKGYNAQAEQQSNRQQAISMKLHSQSAHQHTNYE